MSYIDIKFLNLLSTRLPKFKRKSSKEIEFRKWNKNIKNKTKMNRNHQKSQTTQKWSKVIYMETKLKKKHQNKLSFENRNMYKKLNKMNENPTNLKKSKMVQSDLFVNKV